MRRSMTVLGMAVVYVDFSYERLDRVKSLVSREERLIVKPEYYRLK